MTKRDPRDRRCAAAGAVLVTAIVLAVWPGTPRVWGQEPVAGNPALGLAHVDLMDLHVERLPEGGPRDRELLPAADLAARFDMAAPSGASWDRWSLYWDMVEREGRFDWAAADGIVRRDVAAGLRTLAILQGTPVEHATAGVSGMAVPRVGGWLPDEVPSTPDNGRVSPHSSPPKSLDAPAFRRSDGSLTDDPADATSVNPGNPWASFVAAAVGRYRPGGELAVAQGWPPGVGVRAWEVGNEPNLAHFWSGTPAQYARFLEVAFLVVEWLDPEAIVMHGGIADGSNAETWYAAFLDALRVRANASPLPERYGYYFDRAAWHWYTYPSLLLSGPRRARALLAGRGLPEKPIWVTEMGVPIWSEYPGPCWDPTSPWRASVPEQAGYIWQALAEGLAASVEVMFHFQLFDDCGNGPATYDAFGLVRNPASNQCWIPPAGQDCWHFDPALAGKPRPAYEAFRVAARELSGVELLWRPDRDRNFWQRVLFYRPPDTRVTVVWNWLRTEQTAELYGTGAEAAVYSLDADGAVQAATVRPEAGRIRLALPGTTNRNNPGNQAPVMAGRPLIVVERDTFPPFRAQVLDLPAVSPTRFELTISAADGGTGVGAYRAWVATSPPASVDDWESLIDERSWPAPPLTGEVRVPFEGEPGRTYYFAVQARDRAGNWTRLDAEAQASTTIAGTAVPTSTPGSTATAAIGPAQTATPTVEVTTTATATAPTASSDTPTSTAPPEQRILLPMVGRDHPRPGSSLPGATPTCRRYAPRIRDGRGSPLTGEDVRWWVRAFGTGHGQGRTFQGSADVSVCIAPPPERAVAWAEAPGFVTFPPQDLDLSADLYLAAAPNLVANGGFEAGLDGWLLSGSTLPQGSADALSGSGAVVLGTDFIGQPELGGGGNSTMSQELLLSADAPILSFEYRFDSIPTCDLGRCEHLDRLEVIVVALDDPTLPASYLTGEEGVREPAEQWAHRWFDLSLWSGQRVRVILNLYQPDDHDPSRLWLDNLAVGAAAPTIMGLADAGANGTARPGETF